MIGSPGHVFLHDDQYGPSYFDDGLRRGGDGLRVRGRWTAGEELKPGQLVVLVGGLVSYWTEGATNVLGVVLARPGRNWYEPGDLVPILRRGVVVVDGKLAGDLEQVRVTDGGLFVATGGATIEGAVSWRGIAIQLNL